MIDTRHGQQQPENQPAKKTLMNIALKKHSRAGALEILAKIQTEHEKQWNQTQSLRIEKPFITPKLAS